MKLTTKLNKTEAIGMHNGFVDLTTRKPLKHYLGFILRQHKTPLNRKPSNGQNYWKHSVRDRNALQQQTQWVKTHKTRLGCHSARVTGDALQTTLWMPPQKLVSSRSGVSSEEWATGMTKKSAELKQPWYRINHLLIISCRK